MSADHHDVMLQEKDWKQAKTNFFSSLHQCATENGQQLAFKGLRAFTDYDPAKTILAVSVAKSDTGGADPYMARLSQDDWTCWDSMNPKHQAAMELGIQQCTD